MLSSSPFSSRSPERDATTLFFPLNLRRSQFSVGAPLLYPSGLTVDGGRWAVEVTYRGLTVSGVRTIFTESSVTLLLLLCLTLVQ